MRRMAVVLLGLVVLMLAATAAWFVMQSGAPESGGGGRSTASGTSTDDGSEDDVAEQGDGARRERVRPGGSDDSVDGGAVWSLVGKVVDDRGPVANADVTVYALGADDDVSDALRVLREELGDRFPDEDLAFLEREARNGGMFGGRGRVSAQQTADESEVVDGEVVEESTAPRGSVTVTISNSSTSVTTQGSSSEDVAAAVNRGQSIAKRMFSEDGLLDRLMTLGQLAAADFEADGDFTVVGRARTATDGSFEIAGLPASRVEVRVRAPAHVRLKRRVSKSNKELVLAMRRGAVLEGLVIAAGQPVVGARVRTKTATLATTGGGTFRLDGAVTPRESVLVSAEGYISAARVVPLSLDAPNDPITIELEPAGEIQGIVVDADGAPIAGAVVTTVAKSMNPMMFARMGNMSSFDAPPPSARSGADGLFVLGGLTPGVVSLLGERDGYLAGRLDDVEVRARQTTVDVRVVLQPESVLTGQVTGPRGQPLAGATVEVEAPAPQGFMAMAAQAMGGAWTSAETDQAGRFRVTRLHAGERRVRVRSEGFLKAENTVQFVAGETTERDFRLEEGHRISGIVFDPTGAPRPGATVFVSWPGDATNPMMARMMGAQTERRTAVTDESGRFVADGLDVGPYTVEARYPGHLAATVENIAQGAEGVEITLGAAATIRGVVIDESGAPVGGATVVLDVGGGGARRGAPWMAMLGDTTTTQSDAAGRFELTGLDPARYQLKARAAAHADSDALSIECKAGAVEDGIELVLRPAATVSGRVIQQGDGSPVSGAIVYVSRAEGPMANINPADALGGEPAAPPDSIHTATDADGRFVLDGLNPGAVTLQVRSRDHAPASLANVTAPSAAVTVEISAGGAVEGVVQDARGNALVGEQIMLTGGAMGFGTQRSATTDAEGVYRLERLRPGAYNLMRLGGDSGAFGMSGMVSVTVRDGETTRHDFKPRADTSRVTGTIVLGTAPLADAAVILSGGSGGGMQIASSDKDGSFAFENVSPGDYTVTVQRGMMGGGTTQAKVRVPAGGGVVPPVRLTISALVVRGRVLDAATDAPIGFAQVVLLDPGASRFTSLEDVMSAQRGQAFTGDDGRFTIEGVTAGSFSLRVSAADYVERTIEGVSAGGADLTVRMDPGSELRITVNGPDGRPVSGASVLVLDDSGSESLPFRMSGQGATGEDGVATLRLGPGRHRLSAESATHPAIEFEVDGQAGSATVTLPAGGALDVTVMRDGQPVAGVAVAVLDAKGKPIEKRVTMTDFGGSGRTTDDAGRVHRDGLPAGQVIVVVTNTQGETSREIATIPAGGTAALTVELL